MAFNGDGIIFKVDISGGVGDEDYRAAGRGFYNIEFELGDRILVRRLVDGDRCVPVSESLAVRAEFIRDDSDPVQAVLLSAADEGCRVRFICGEGKFARSGSGVPVISRVSGGGIRGVCYVLEIRG